MVMVGTRFRRRQSYVEHAYVSVGRKAKRYAVKRTPGSGSLPTNRRLSYPARGREAGVSLVELTVTLCLLMGIAQFGMQTMTSAWIQQNWSIKQSMTDAYAGIETAYAQRWTFSTIPSTDVELAPDLTKTTPYTLWPIYPNSSQTQVTIGQLPQIAQMPQVKAQVIRTCKQPFIDPNTGAPSFQDPVTGATAYLLESYVIYQDGQRKYCKVSKVYRDE